MKNIYVISTKNRNNISDDPGNCVVELQQEIVRGSYQLSYAMIPNNLKNVNSTNNTVYFYDSTSRTATLTSGFYSVSNIANELQTSMNAVSSGYSVSFDETTQKLTITKSSGTFYFTFGTNTSNSANELLGFNPSDGSAASSQTSDNVINLSTYLYYNLSINMKRTFKSSSNSGQTFYLPIQSNNLDYIIYNNVLPKQIIEFHDDEKYLQLKLYDDANQLVSLDKSNFFFVLESL